MSNSLDPDQDRQYVGPDLGPNCLQRLSADDTRRQRVYKLNLNIINISILCIPMENNLSMSEQITEAVHILGANVHFLFALNKTYLRRGEVEV